MWQLSYLIEIYCQGLRNRVPIFLSINPHWEPATFCLLPSMAHRQHHMKIYPGNRYVNMPPFAKYINWHHHMSLQSWWSIDKCVVPIHVGKGLLHRLYTISSSTCKSQVRITQLSLTHAKVKSEIHPEDMNLSFSRVLKKTCGFLSLPSFVSCS